MMFYRKLYIHIGIVVAITIAIIVANYLLMMYLSRLASQLQQHRMTLNNHAHIIEDEAALKADLARAQREGSYLDNILPAPDNLIDFPRDISVWAAQYAVDVGFSFVKELPAVDSGPPRTTFVLTGRGSLPHIFNLLHQLEISRYLIEFTQFDIVSDAGDTYTLLINGQIFSR